MGRVGVQQFDGVRVASTSSIEIDFYYHGQRCKERLKLEPTASNLKRAAAFRGAILDAIDKGTFDYTVSFPKSKNARKFVKGNPEVVGLSTQAYLEKWLDAKEKQVKASTHDDYRKIVVHIWVPKLGNILLKDLKRTDIKEVVKTMTCSNKRIANVLSVLRAALEEAVDDELIEHNPIHDWGYANKEAPKDDDDVDPFTRDEQAAILKKCDGQIRNLIQFAFWSGLRTSELVALDWGDIDWRRGVVRITKAITQASDDVEDTKTRAGRREVKLLGPALEALTAQKKHTYLANQEVFQDPRYGKRWAGDQPIRQGFWVKILQLAKVRYRRPYQTRHTYASMMLSAGEHPMWVAAQMGHSDWGMIRRIYGRFMPEATPEAGNKAEALFGGAKNVDKNVDQTAPSDPSATQSHVV